MKILKNDEIVLNFFKISKVFLYSGIELKISHYHIYELASSQFSFLNLKFLI